MKSAHKDDIEVIQQLYHQAIERTQRTGGEIDWPYPFPLERIEQYFNENSLFTFMEGDQTVATIRMYENCSPEIWEDVATTNALYIGKAATADVVSGRNYLQNHIFPEVIDYAAAHRYDHVRFDSLATNERQMRLYEKSVFEKVGEAIIRSINNGNRIQLAKWQYDVQ